MPSATMPIGETFDLYSPSIHSLATGMCGSQRADDVVIETILDVWCFPERFSSSRVSTKAALLSAAHLRCVQHLRADRLHRNEKLSIKQAMHQVFNRDPRLSAQMLDLNACEKMATGLAYYGGYTTREVAALSHQSHSGVLACLASGLIKLTTSFTTPVGGS